MVSIIFANQTLGKAKGDGELHEVSKTGLVTNCQSLPAVGNLRFEYSL